MSGDGADSSVCPTTLIKTRGAWQVSPHMPIQRMAAALLSPLISSFATLSEAVQSYLAALVNADHPSRALISGEHGADREPSQGEWRGWPWHIITYNLLKLQVWSAQVRASDASTGICLWMDPCVNNSAPLLGSSVE